MGEIGRRMKAVPAPGSGEQQQIDTYRRLAAHPFFAECFDSNLCLSDAMVKRLDDLADAIVIERAELPTAAYDEEEREVHASSKVEDREASAWTSALGTSANGALPQWHRAKALAHLAVAEYLDANPPVDEAQVTALAKVLADSHDTRRAVVGPWAALADQWDEIARALVARGVRIEVTP